MGNRRRTAVRNLRDYSHSQPWQAASTTFQQSDRNAGFSQLGRSTGILKVRKGVEKDLDMFDWNSRGEGSGYTVYRQGWVGRDLQLGSSTNIPGVTSNDVGAIDGLDGVLHLEQGITAYAINGYDQDDPRLGVNSSTLGIPINTIEAAEEFTDMLNKEWQELATHMVIEYELDRANQQMERYTDFLYDPDNGDPNSDIETAEELNAISNWEQEELAMYEMDEREQDTSILEIPDIDTQPTEWFNGMLDCDQEELATYEIIEHEYDGTDTPLGVDISGASRSDVELAEELDKILAWEQEEIFSYIDTNIPGIPSNDWEASQEFYEMEVTNSPPPPEDLLQDSESQAPAEPRSNPVLLHERVQSRARVVRESEHQQRASVSNPELQSTPSDPLRRIHRYQRHRTRASRRYNRDSSSTEINITSERILRSHRERRPHVAAVPQAQPRQASRRSYSSLLSDSGSEDEDIPEGLECVICQRRLANVMFKGCVHRACISCVKGIWHARKKADTHFPDYFPCHQCRTEIKEVGMVSEEKYEFGLVLSNEDFIFEIEVTEWLPIRQWMAERSKRVAEGCRRFMVPLALHTPRLEYRRIRRNSLRHLL